MTKLSKRDPATDHFTQQFANPKEVTSILLLLGGNVVQKAVAQLTGGRHTIFTPVVFSFGWVAYAVNSVATAVGDGTFLPRPDYPGCVITVGSGKKIGSGDRRDNQSWVLGRLIRDLELRVERSVVDKKLLNSGLMVTIFELDPCQGKPYKPLKPRKDWLWWSFTWGIALQLGIASIPWGLSGNWSIFLTTAVGNLLAILTASLPSMRTAKSGFRENSQQSYAITGGNGHNHVFIILPDTLAVQIADDGATTNCSTLPYLDEMASSTHRASIATRLLSVTFAVLWIMLLVAIGGLESDTWYLFGAGMVGMILNIMVSGWPRGPEAHGIPLKETNDRFGFPASINDPRPRVKDVLLELERRYPGAGHALRPVFFNGLPSDKDKDWDADDISWTTTQARLDRIIGFT